MKLNRNIIWGIFIIILFSEMLFCSEKDKICPFELISFNAETIRDSVNRKLIVNLEWITASEFNTDKFIVERKDLDVITFLVEKEFIEIGEMTAAGTSSTAKTYNFVDTLLLDLQPVIYRIKGVDKDGSFSYTDEKFIVNFTDVDEQRNSNPVSIIENIYPNPANGFISIEINLLSPSLVEIQLFDINGDEVIPAIRRRFDEVKSFEIIDISEMASGEYNVVIKIGSSVEFRKIVLLK